MADAALPPSSTFRSKADAEKNAAALAYFYVNSIGARVDIATRDGAVVSGVVRAANDGNFVLDYAEVKTATSEVRLGAASERGDSRVSAPLDALRRAEGGSRSRTPHRARRARYPPQRRSLTPPNGFSRAPDPIPPFALPTHFVSPLSPSPPLPHRAARPRRARARRAARSSSARKTSLPSSRAPSATTPRPQASRTARSRRARTRSRTARSSLRARRAGSAARRAKGVGSPSRGAARAAGTSSP
jgi:hypothetical protein